MTEKPLAKDHKTIWLAPRCEVDERAWSDQAHDCEECGLKAVKYVRADLAAAPPPPAGEEWQPIETAPKDGKPFLATDGVERVIFVADEDGDNEIRTWLGLRKFSPTCWQPLPALPALALSPPQAKP